MDAAWISLVLITAGALYQPKEAVAGAPVEPVNRTAYFSGQDGWSGSGSVAPLPTTTYDRYGQPIASGQTPVVQAPSNTTRAQNGFSGSNASIRDGIEAGIRAGNQQYSNATGGTAPLSSPFSTTANAPPNTNTTVRGGVSAPTWPTNSNSQGFASTPMSSGVPTNRTGLTGPVAMEGGWTSIGTAIAAPPLLVPQSPMTTTNFGNPSAATGRTSFPAIAANDQQPLHSVLAEPARPTQPLAAPADDYGWGNNSASAPAGISKTANGSSLGSTVRDSDLVPVRPSGTSQQDPRRQNGTRPGDSWAETDPWAQPAQPSLGPATGSISANKPLATNGTGNSQQYMSNGQSPFGPASTGQAPNGQFTGNYNNGNANPGLNPAGNNQAGNNSNLFANGRNQTGGTLATESQAWMPWILAVLGLAGSLATNLYLGVSYLDARQKYQSLVRKTADTFRRVKSAAA